MEKYLLLICASFSLAACASQDEEYYRLHPQLLQQAVQACPVKKPSLLSCEELSQIARSTHELAYQLQASPQAFGKSILELQQTLAKQEAELRKNPNQPALQSEIKKNKRNLAERLAIVKWLESPES
jgi:hypothetical protein